MHTMMRVAIGATLVMMLHAIPAASTDQNAVHARANAATGAPGIWVYPGAPCNLSYQWYDFGDAAGDYFGFSVDGGGDYNGDGEIDVLVGALLGDEVYCYYVDMFGEFNRGTSWNGDTGDDFGRCVRFVAVPDNLLHGTSTAMIGAPGHSAPNDSCGMVVERGRQNQFGWVGNGDGHKLGYSLDNVGDLNGDGYEEIIVGAPAAASPLGPEAGYALLLSQYPGSGNQLHRFERGIPGERFGTSVAAAGDIDGDGVQDVVIGAPLASHIGPAPDNVGAVFVYRVDGTLIRTVYGEGSHDYFGNSVANAGDVNNDGWTDLLVGAWRADPNGMTNAGAAYVYSGEDGSFLFRFIGEGPNHNFGYSVSGLGDVDQDGYDDLIIGAHRADLFGATDGGAVYVYSGQNGDLLWRLSGDGEDGQCFGVSVAAIGDFTHDGRPDFVAGAFATDWDGKVDAGSAWMLGCNCDCVYNGDPAHDGVTDVLDVVGTVSDAFRGDPNEKSSSCRYCDSDVNCSGACDIVDVVKMIGVAFRGADKATEFCSPCQP